MGHVRLTDNDGGPLYELKSRWSPPVVGLHDGDVFRAPETRTESGE